MGLVWDKFGTGLGPVGTRWDELGLVGSEGDQALSSWVCEASQGSKSFHNLMPNLLGLSGTSWE